MRIGVVGTSWWVDAMYLPALAGLDDVQVVAMAGRRRRPATLRARRWGIPAVYTDWAKMFDSEDLDGVIVAAPNPVHYPVAAAALDRGLALLCEKPVGMDLEQAADLVSRAETAGVTTMVPFTYAFMPGFRFMARQVEQGFVGEIRHLALRYHTGFGLQSEYDWKFDARLNPAGALADIGSHFIYLGRILAGPICGVTARLDSGGRRSDVDPTGEPYPAACDVGTVILDFASGSHGILEFSTLSFEGGSMDQRHVIEVHGTEGTLRYEVDWDRMQRVVGARLGDHLVDLPIPDDLWGGVRRDTVHNTYRDVFRTTDVMARQWALAIATRRRVTPDLKDGAAVQAVIDASLRSSALGGTSVVNEEWR